MTASYRNLITDKLVMEQEVEAAICTDDPLGLALVPEEYADCSASTVSDATLDLHCTGQVVEDTCVVDLALQLLIERDGDSVTGSGQWSAADNGLCGFTDSDRGETIAITGARLSPDPGACDLTGGGFGMKFLSHLMFEVVEMDSQ
jgi:hypothetical protein